MLVDAEQRAARQHPHQVPEAGVGVLVDHRVGAEKLAVPGTPDIEVAHRDGDVVESGEGHGLISS
jgi:hypothetical protein